ncbi:MAG: DNA polymerase III subunit beta [Candidatus Yanofskybacteria bacterium RIFCSPLOWO2_01_FULL_49_25]|uniref:Beta sliding clamp n=1 Tax=Candidatus Yanofskybacteria bacterium RIFCSPLOWO2_01_FULL_49_25 TaxID=1802701 RepID=A0A1F8GYQ2_9BACT|nr:MAG: DNA polymerase III subunit beta [Candidatus Yanofskybacteria bacterium RIFCSPLOWO2_01_FULL_49_25]
MNITINHNKFSQAIRTVERIVGKTVSLPILSAVLLRADHGQLKLSATNLEMGVQAWVSAKVDTEGSLAIPARVLSEFISTVTDEKVTLTTEKDILTLSSDHFKTQILGIKPDEFPIIPSVNEGATISIDSSVLCLVLGSVVDAASTLESRPELAGVCMQFNGKKLTCAATDSFRLSERSVPAEGSPMKQIIIPRATAQEVFRLASNTSEPIRITASETQISFKSADFELVSRLIDGHYPDYKRVIPEKLASSASVARTDLEQNVRMASIFTSSVADLRLSVDSAMLHVLAKNSDRGEMASHCPAKLTGGSFDVTVNYHYILDGIKALNTERVVIGFSGPGTPLVMRGEGASDQVYVIMPLRTP